LQAEPDVELVDPPGDLEASDDGEVADLASALRAFETLFQAEGVERLVLAGTSNRSLAALLVATKMSIPVGTVTAPDEDEDGPFGMNARVIERLADEALADEGSVAGWLREPQKPSQGAAEH
jgi:UDP-N-acetylglucosamine 2-epimerase